MLTTTPNSKVLWKERAPKRLWWLLFLILGGLLSGCVGMPKAEDFFKLTPESVKHRALQTRMFETSNEKELLSASAAVLLDLGFQVEESSTEVGVLRAAKERSAREYGQEILQVFIFLLGAVGGKAIIMPVDLHQQINATLVTRRSESDSSRFSVRIHFYRTVWKGDGNTGDQNIPPGQQRPEMIYDGKIYQQFFAKLSKSVFLEAHQI
ncbi:MAG: hypothetical protein L6263_11015 [Desulfobacteraceae bacterium]|nr:hypothetical protein [Desulfobacteraceae bacterium]